MSLQEELVELDARLDERRRNKRRCETGELRPFRQELGQSKAEVANRGQSHEMPPQLARAFSEWLCRELGKDGLGHEDRPVYVTLYPGGHGTAGYVITINGSPCRGVVIINLDGLGSPSGNMWLIDPGRKKLNASSYKAGPGRGIGNRRYAIVKGFLNRMGLMLDMHDKAKLSRSKPDSGDDSFDALDNLDIVVRKLSPRGRVQG